MKRGFLAWLAVLCLVSAAQAATGDYERALDLLRARKLPDAVAALQSAEAGNDPRAANALGELYQTGFGVPRDETRACDLFEKAAKADIVTAARNFADCFFWGKGGRAQDYAQSKYWYERGIAANDAPAFCSLGAQYRRGLGVPKDAARAVALCAQGAELGDAEAQADLGEMYLAGTDVPRDAAAALQLLTKAAAQNHGRAMLNLGLMYWNGDGVAKDLNRARGLVLGACRAGVESAYLYAGQLFFAASVDKEKNQVREDAAWVALFWLALAAERDPQPEKRTAAQQLYAALAKASPQSVLARANEALRLRKAQESALGVKP